MDEKGHAVRPEALLRMRGKVIFWGPGHLELFSKIEECGSIKAAAQEMFMSYSKARRLIAVAEQELGVKLVESHKGGARRGKTELTEYGQQYLNSCRKLQKELQEFCDTRYQELFRSIIPTQPLGKRDLS